jgi:hypothetical protein
MTGMAMAADHHIEATIKTAAKLYFFISKPLVP